MLFKGVGLLFLYVFTFCSRQWLKSEDIQRISLFFHNKSLEKEVEWRTSAPLTPPAHQPALTHCYSLFFCTSPPSSPSVLQITRRLTPSESWALLLKYLKFLLCHLLSDDVVSIFLVQSNNFASLQILRNLRLSDLRLHLHRADSRPSKVCMTFFAIILTDNCPALHSAWANTLTTTGMKLLTSLRCFSFLQDHEMIKTTSVRAHSTSLTVQHFNKDYLCTGTSL